jgi:pimeloyl-ACP methyl ester carboxylesterase
MTVAGGHFDLEERSFDTGEGRINYVKGPGYGSPLLLLHGVISNWRSFEAIIPYLGENTQVFAMDLRGHGKSGWVQNGYKIEDYANDVVEFIQAEINDPAIILGHSLGALVTIRAAADLPQRTRAAILLDPPLVYRRTLLKDSPSKRDRNTYNLFMKASEIINSSESINDIENHLERVFPDQSAGGRSELARRLSDMDPNVLEMVIGSEHVADYDIEALVDQITCPVLLIQADRSLGAALDDIDAEYLATHMKRCELVQIEGAGHNLHETHPQVVGKEIGRFLGTL